MKTAILAALFAVALGCNKKKDSGTTAGGLEACDEYFAVVDKCVANADEGSKDAWRQSAEQFKKRVAEATDDASKEAVASACKQAADNTRTNPLCK